VEAKKITTAEIMEKHANELYSQVKGTNQEWKTFEELDRVLRDVVRGVGQIYITKQSLSEAQRLAGISAALNLDKYSKPIQNLIQAAALNEKFWKKAQLIRSIFEAKVSTARNEVYCTVQTAEALTPQQTAKLQERITKVSNGKKPILKTEVNPEILGGLILQIGERRYNLSVATQLKNLQRSLEVL